MLFLKTRYIAQKGDWILLIFIDSRCFCCGLAKHDKENAEMSEI
jgi:hypothetical protein